MRRTRCSGALFGAPHNINNFLDDKKMKSSNQPRDFQPCIKLPALIILAFFALLLFCSTGLWARPMTERHAEKIVRGWLKADVQPFGMALGWQIMSIETFSDGKGPPIYYVVYLQPSGFVIVPADDLVEPIICFASSGTYDPSDDNPLGALVSRDLPGRIAMAWAQQVAAGSAAQQTAFQRASVKAQSKWANLQTYDDMAEGDIIGALGESGISDVRVAPLVQSKWNQGNYDGSPCYNYYTEFDGTRYPTGCTATAMAQLIRYHEQQPVVGVGTPSFTIQVDGNPVQASLRGGDALGGPYVWGDMVQEPDSGITETQRQAIGALCYDAGVSIGSLYEIGGTGGSLAKVIDRLKDTYEYSNMYKASDFTGLSGAGFNGMVNSNLDANYPVLLSISAPTSGHSVICDGYGYDALTLYHHLNMGWGGYYDLWYALPDIGTPYGYDTVGTCVYNIFTSGTGEIISGRVTDIEVGGQPFNGVSITAEINGGSSYYTTSNSEGIYAFAKVPSNTTFTVSASKSGYYFPSEIVTTGTSSNSNLSGNIRGVDFVGVSSDPDPPIAANSLASTRQGVAVTITLNAYDECHPDPPGILTYIITSLPEHGKLSDPCEGVIYSNELPYTLIGNGNQVEYSPCVFYAGPDDSFSFKANDGGTAPDGGDSNIATVSIEVQMQSTPDPGVVYETDFEAGLPEGWTIVDGYSDGKTWTSTNPGGQTHPEWTGTFMIVDSSWAGYNVNMDEELITHSIDCSYYQDVTLNFMHAFVYGSSFYDEVGDVDVSVNGGAWQNVARYESYHNGLEELDLSSIADGQADVKIRWRYYNTKYEYFWGIDDVEIIAASLPQPMPGDFEPDCDVDFTDFAILASAWLSNSGQTHWNPACDISDPNDNVIDLFDLAVFTENWLTGITP